MIIERVNPKIKYIYHYTSKENVKKIMQDKKIISKDKYVFFTESLRDSITAFEREMMVEDKLYIDVNGVLKKRKKCNKSDYCILRIPYKNDGQFYKFTFENQTSESIYSISLSHKGEYNFSDAKVIEFPTNKMLKVLTKAATAAIITGVILFPYNTFAASWLDTNNYDISWYTSNPSSATYQINTAKEMAGLAHLVNEENMTFSGKGIKFSSDIDLSENKWETIKSIFNGSICGSHRFILNWLDGNIFENRNVDNLYYAYNVYIDSSRDTQKIILPKPYTIAKLKEETGARAVFVNNKELLDDTILNSSNITKNDVIDVFMHKFITIEDTIRGIKIPIRLESGDSIENVKMRYSEKTNIPVDKMIIMYKNKKLNDERTLADYNIQMDETINVYTKIEINMIAENDGNVIESQNITSMSGEKVKIKFNPGNKYIIEKVLVNGINKTNEISNNELDITCADKDIDIKATYKLINDSKKDENNKENEDKKDDNKNNGTKQDEDKKDEIKQDEKKEDETKKDDKEINDKSDKDETILDEDKNKEQQSEKENQVIEETERETKTINNPKTGDNITWYIVAFFNSIAGIVISFFKRKNK